MKTVKKSFPVVGMSCAGCSARVDKTLNKQHGIVSATVNLAAAMATVEYNPDECTPEQLKEAVRKIGFDLIIEEKKEVQKEADEARKHHYKTLKVKTLLAIVLAIPVSVIAMFFHVFTICHTLYIQWLCFPLWWYSDLDTDFSSMPSNFLSRVVPTWIHLWH